LPARVDGCGAVSYRVARQRTNDPSQIKSWFLRDSPAFEIVPELAPLASGENRKQRTAKQHAPWLSTPSVTPMERWYAEYHARELTVPLIRNAYQVLRIPADHIRVDREIPQALSRMKARSPNPYHTVTIRDEGYADGWRAMAARTAD
jgi:hypothetical protein